MHHELRRPDTGGRTAAGSPRVSNKAPCELYHPSLSAGQMNRLSWSGGVVAPVAPATPACPSFAPAKLRFDQHLILCLCSRRRFPVGDQKGTQYGRDTAQFCGCPRNCKRRIFSHIATGTSAPGRRRKVVTRKPGDLPSAVVTREHVGRGVLAVAEP